MIANWGESLTFDDNGEFFSPVVASSKLVHFVPEAKVYNQQANSGGIDRGTSEKARLSLLLFLTACILYLRALEDTGRSRDACVKSLQTWSDCLYPEKTDLYVRIFDLARELGGNLSPAAGPKIPPLQEIFRSDRLEKYEGGGSGLETSGSVQLGQMDVMKGEEA